MVLIDNMVDIDVKNDPVKFFWDRKFLSAASRALKFWKIAKKSHMKTHGNPIIIHVKRKLSMYWFQKYIHFGVYDNVVASWEPYRG